MPAKVEVYQEVPELERRISETLGPISIRQEQGRYVAQIPRHALVAVGTKTNRFE